MGIPMPVESAVHEVDLSDEWAALSQQLEEAIEQEMPGAPVAEPEAIPAAVAQSREDEEVAEEIPAFDLELQPVTLSGAAENEALSGDAMLAGLMADMESATENLGLPEEMAQADKSRGAAALVFGKRAGCTFGFLQRGAPGGFAWRQTLRRTGLWATCLMNFAPNWAN